MEIETQRGSGLHGPSSNAGDSKFRNETSISNERPSTNDTLGRSTWPQTPHRATPNSSRKRLYTPVLFRNTASPSHSAKMSTLFEVAASSLQYPMTSSRHSYSNVKQPRMPSSQTRLTKFGNAHDVDFMSAPWPTCECGNDDGSALKPTEQGYETVDPPPIRGCPTMSPRPQVTADHCSVYDSPTHLPHPSITTDPIELVAELRSSHDLLDDTHAREPISSGFATPAHNNTSYLEMPAASLHPDVGSWKLPQSSPPVNQSDSDDEEHSTHGVRLIMPYSHCQAEEAQQANIDAWLDQVLGANSEDAYTIHQLCQDEIGAKDVPDTVLPSDGALEGFSTDSDLESTREDRPPSHRSSNKENVPPPLPRRVPPPPYKSLIPTPSRFRSHADDSTMLPRLRDSTTNFSNPLLPGSHLSAPPKRKKPRVYEAVSTPSKPERSTPQDFTIHDDDLAAALAKLSPSVERHRKGRGPKRERCASYWDTDVLDPDSPADPGREPSSATEGRGKLLRNGKRVLAETTTPDAFMQGIVGGRL